MARVGFIGLGVMGEPMAGHLVKAGHELTTWSRRAEQSARLAESGVRVVKALEELPDHCDVIFLCVTRSEDVTECLGRMAPCAKAGTLFVDHSTISPSVAIELHRKLADLGHRFVDAPITGGSMGAQSGQLTIFCGGAESDIDEALPLMRAYAKRAERVGEAGAGQMMKMANQIAVGGALIGLCESLSFAKKAGLDLKQTSELLSGGAAGSWAFNNYGPKILDADWSPGFSIGNQRKDFVYCAEAAMQIDAAVPGTLLVDQLLKRLEENGGSQWTTAALYEALLEMGWSDHSRCFCHLSKSLEGSGPSK